MSTVAACRLVAAPRVAESPAALECKVVEVVEIKSLSGAWSGAVLTLGEVVAFHIDERFLRDGLFDTALAHPLARCAYQDYAAVEDVFALARPKGGGEGELRGRRIPPSLAERSRPVPPPRRFRSTDLDLARLNVFGLRQR